MTWHPDRATVKKAVVRDVTDDHIHLLQHIRTIRTRQRGATTADVDERPELDDLPSGILAALRGEGLRLATGAER